MICSKCNTEFNDGKFCPNCGNPVTTDDQSNATQNTNTSHSDPAKVASNTEQPATSDFAQQVKSTSSSFGQFFLNIVKKPNNARQAHTNDFISGVIAIALIALLFGVRAWILGNSLDIEFVDAFLKPFAKALLFMALVAGGVVGVSILGKQEYDPKEVIAKFGAFLIPFGLVYLAGILLSSLDMDVLAHAVLLAGSMGIYLIAPILTLTIKPSKGLDLIYLFIIYAIIAILVNSYLEIGIFAFDNPFDLLGL